MSTPLHEWEQATFDPSNTTVAEAQEWLFAHAEEGAVCPVCTRKAKVYRWSLYSTAGAALVLLYRMGAASDFVHSRGLKDFGHKGQGDASRLKNWGLLEEEKVRRPDGGRSGHWMLTEKGVDFVLGRTTVPKYVHVYANEVLVTSGGQVSIREVLGDKFDYGELMSR